MTKQEMLNQYTKLSKQTHDLCLQLSKWGVKDYEYPKTPYARPTHTKQVIQERIDSLTEEFNVLADKVTYFLDELTWERIEMENDPTYWMMINL